ncbi:hypothetical protein BGZ65_002810 [Modicella reniformis]|uniref:Ricin B lectin domain-containing protein n=1 Tax=Modicella reniformis TaxID=1440133 RepID=A0A9P6LZT4_9FUNG|nr:hypothetical protein BGZ65_002810 [Modicella reniformis]
MVGRSLLSLLAVAAVAIQSCVAGVIENGIYRISLENHYQLLTASNPYPEAPLELLPARNDRGSQLWWVENHENQRIVLQNIGSSLYAAPRNTKQQVPFDSVVLSVEEFQWHSIPSADGNGIVLIRPSVTPVANPLVASMSPLRIYPPQVDIQELRFYDKSQEWTFDPLKRFKKVTKNHCGVTFKNPKTEKIHWPAGRIKAVITSFVLSFISLVSLAIFVPKLDAMWTLSSAFKVLQWSLQFDYVQLTAFATRFKYYPFWKMDEGACVLAGFGQEKRGL